MGKVTLRYVEQPGIEVHSISVLGSFLNYDAEKGQMNRDGADWVFETELVPGEYCYKFLINDTLLLNDPEANCYVPRQENEEQELWSFLRIGSAGERLYNNTQYSVNVEEYLISGAVTEGEGVTKHRFSTILDKKVVVRFGFNRVQGLHPVTLVWCDHAGMVREYVENTLYPEGDTANVSYLWFWLDLETLEQAEGMWTAKLFIDGRYLLEDQFQIGNAFLYSADGKLGSF